MSTSVFGWWAAPLLAGRGFRSASVCSAAGCSSSPSVGSFAGASADVSDSSSTPGPDCSGSAAWRVDSEPGSVAGSSSPALPAAAVAAALMAAPGLRSSVAEVSVADVSAAPVGVGSSAAGCADVDSPALVRVWAGCPESS